MYTEGLHIKVQNKSKKIQTFGINLNTDTFIEIGQQGNEPLKRFTDKVVNGKNAILFKEWKTNNFKIQQVIHEIINCNYQNELKELFLLSKSIELLVLQADLYGQQDSNHYIKTTKDKRKIIEAKEILISRIDNQPTIIALSKLTGLNEYKLKKGFKALHGTTIFGYIHGTRMNLAKSLLLGTDKTAQEIAYEIGYSSPQHFSKAFKNTFGVSPNSIRNNPDSITADNHNAAPLDF
ncbi:MAG: AraC family transcriptional regulator [Bacteroidota bacterium]